MREKLIIGAICCLAIAGLCGVSGGNPIMPGADPHAIAVGATTWVYPTWNNIRRTQAFFAFSSTNLTDWERHGPVLDFKDVSWIRDDGADRHYAWAPSVFESQGKFYFYYSVGPQNPTPSRIGVAVGDKPEGPFKDSGKPLLTGGSGFEAIDPMVFKDPQSGTTYLYAGGSAGAKLRVFILNSNLVSIAREVLVVTPKYFTEGAFMHCHQGSYYLSYSHGNWQDSSYSVHYATAESPVGPFQYRGCILQTEGSWRGPGHHSILREPGTGRWRIFYHRWETPEIHGTGQGQRHLCVDELLYDPEGLICPIRMTGKRSEEVSKPAR
jgi:beta-xylosidase